MARSKEMEAPIVWEVGIPLITNGLILKTWAKALGATYLVVMTLMAVLFVSTHQAKSLPTLAWIFAAVCAAIFAAGLLVMLLVFGNRYRARFAITEKGIHYESLDRRASRLARAGAILGAAAGSPQTAGAGLLAMSQETMSLAWKGAFNAVYAPRQHTVRLRNRWRDLLHVTCTPDNYEAVSARIEREMERHGTRERLMSQRSPLPGALARTAGVILACLPLFALVDVTSLHLLIPLTVLLFALTTVWFVPLFGWVVLCLEGYVLLHLSVALFSERKYTLISTYTFRNVEVLDAGEWVAVVGSLAGLVYLAWISARYLRGRTRSVLMQDMEGID
jgi:hypothetical protein